MLLDVDEYELVGPCTDPILPHNYREYLRLIKKLDRLHMEHVGVFFVQKNSKIRMILCDRCGFWVSSGRYTLLHRSVNMLHMKWRGRNTGRVGHERPHITVCSRHLTSRASLRVCPCRQPWSALSGSPQLTSKRFRCGGFATRGAGLGEAVQTVLGDVLDCRQQVTKTSPARRWRLLEQNTWFVHFCLFVSS